MRGLLYKDFGASVEKRKANYKKFLLDFDKENKESYNNFDRPIKTPLFISKLYKV